MSPVLCLYGVVFAGLCTPHDASDIAVASCEPWCAYGANCVYCKCRGCSLCATCMPNPADPSDTMYEACEDWCQGGEQHCVRS